jgi:hypothetical protein
VIRSLRSSALACAIAVSGWLLTSCGPSEHGAVGGTVEEIELVPISATGGELDSAYGDWLLDAGGCLVVAIARAGAGPQVDMYRTDGTRTGGWSARGAGPGELNSIDGISARPDTIVVWDRANGRLTWLGCDGTIRDSHIGLMPGLQVAIAGGGAVAFAHEPMPGPYGLWLREDGRRDSLTPRIGPRIRAARDLLLTGPDGSVVILDVSVGALVWYHPGSISPHRVDTIPSAIAAPFRDAFRTVWASTPELASLDPAPMQVPWASIVDGDILLLGSSGHPPLDSTAAFRLGLRDGSLARIAATSDSESRSVVFGIAGRVVRGDTLFSATVDSFYRFVLKPRR